MCVTGGGQGDGYRWWSAIMLLHGGGCGHLQSSPGDTKMYISGHDKCNSTERVYLRLFVSNAYASGNKRAWFKTNTCVKVAGCYMAASVSLVSSVLRRLQASCLGMYSAKPGACNLLSPI